MISGFVVSLSLGFMGARVAHDTIYRYRVTFLSQYVIDISGISGAYPLALTYLEVSGRALKSTAGDIDNVLRQKNCLN